MHVMAPARFTGFLQGSRCRHLEAVIWTAENTANTTLFTLLYNITYCPAARQTAKEHSPKLATAGHNNILVVRHAVCV